MRGQGNGEGLETKVCPDFPANEDQTRDRCFHEADTASQHDELTTAKETPELTSSSKRKGTQSKLKRDTEKGSHNKMTQHFEKKKEIE